MGCYGVDVWTSIIGALSGTPELVGIISAVVAGALATLIMKAFGVVGVASVIIGVITGIVVAVMLGSGTLCRYARVRRDYRP